MSDLINQKVDLIIITVKSFSTREVAESLRNTNLDSQTIIVSFQNGVSNPLEIKSFLKNNIIIHGMLPFAIKEVQDSLFLQGSTGDCFIGLMQDDHNLSHLDNQHLKALIKAMNDSNLTTQIEPRMVGVAYGKLTVNLNNGYVRLRIARLVHS